MSKRDGFEVVWSAEDGYVGKGRPQTFSITEDDIAGCVDAADLESLLDEMMQDEFAARVSPSAHNAEDFVAWALGVIDKRGDHE